MRGDRNIELNSTLQTGSHRTSLTSDDRDRHDINKSQYRFIYIYTIMFKLICKVTYKYTCYRIQNKNHVKWYSHDKTLDITLMTSQGSDTLKAMF